VNSGAQPIALSGFTLSNNGGLPNPLPGIILYPARPSCCSPTRKRPRASATCNSSWTPAASASLSPTRSAAWSTRSPFRRWAPTRPTPAFPTAAPGAPCRFASPDRSNGDHCGPAPLPELPDGQPFKPYTWPEDPGPPPAAGHHRGGAVSRALVEVRNTSTETLDLTPFALRVAPLSPNTPLPDAAAGSALPWPATSLAPGQRLMVPVAAGRPRLARRRRRARGRRHAVPCADAVDRLDFLRWPTDAVLARVPDGASRFRFCTSGSPGASNDGCTPLATRPVGDRVHSLYTPGDFDALAAGGTELESRSVKFIVDMQTGDLVDLLGTKDWACTTPSSGSASTSRPTWTAAIQRRSGCSTRAGSTFRCASTSAPIGGSCSAPRCAGAAAAWPPSSSRAAT